MAVVELPSLAVHAVQDETGSRRPALLNRDPAPDEVGVPVGAAIRLEIVDTGHDGVDIARTQVCVDGVLAFDGADDPAIRAGYDGPDAGVTQTADAIRIALDPIVPFPSQAVITVRVVSATRGGAGTLDVSQAFTVEDRTAPRVVAAQATGPRTVRIGFDEPIVVVDGTGFSFTPLGAPAVPVDPVTASADGTLVTVTVDTDMTPDVPYEVQITGVVDANGNPTVAPHDRVTFTGFRPSRPPGRHFDLWPMLPRYNRRADVTGDLRRLVSCFQEVTDGQLAQIDRFPDLFDIERAPDPFLDTILQDLGNPFAFDLDTIGKRRLASVLVEMYRQKGTAIGIQNAVRFFLGIEVTAITAFTGTTLVLGESELGVDWEIGPSDSFARYAFDIEVGVPLTKTEQSQIRAIVGYLKPAHTHFVNLRWPGSEPFVDHWELGVSELGETALLH